MQDNTIIFSVENLDIWDIFPLEFFVLLSIPLLIIAFPNLTKIWPFSSFVLFRSRRKAGLITLALVASIIGVHFSVTYLTLQSSKNAFQNHEYDIVEGQFSGVAFSNNPAARIPIGILVDDRVFTPPGSLHGMALPGEIDTHLVEGEIVIIKANKDVFLSIEKPQK